MQENGRNQIITQVNDVEVKNVDDYAKAIQEKFPSKDKIKTIVKTKDGDIILFDNQPPQITVSNIPLSSFKILKL